MKPKVFAIISVLIVVIGVVTAATIYESNLLSGRTTIHPTPAPALTLSTTFPLDVYDYGNYTVFFTVNSTVVGNVTVYVVLNVTSPGIMPSNMTVEEICYECGPHGDSSIPGPFVNATQVTPNELSFKIPFPDPITYSPGDGPYPGQETQYLWVNFYMAGSISWTAQAFGVPTT